MSSTMFVCAVAPGILESRMRFGVSLDDMHAYNILVVPNGEARPRSVKWMYLSHVVVQVTSFR
jgi:hypothetical protein